MTTHTDLIARLRVIANAIADGNYSELTMRIPAEPDRDADIVVMRSALALESLEQQVAALTKERDHYKALWMEFEDSEEGQELAAAQAREEKLRDLTNALLHQIDIGTFVDEHGHSAKMLKATQDAMQFLALPTDDSALQERLKQEREHTLERVAGFFDSVKDRVNADAIRGLA